MKTQNKTKLIELLNEAIMDGEIAVFDETSSIYATVTDPACANGTQVQITTAGEGRKPGARTDAELAKDLYTALLVVTMNQRTGLREIPARAKIHRELVESSTVNGITSLEHAEKLLTEYRNSHPEMWDKKTLSDIAKRESKLEKLTPAL